MNNDAVLPRPMLLSAWLRFLDAPLAQVPSADVVIGSVAVGAAFDLAMRSEILGIAGAACVALAAVVLLASRRVRNPQAIALIAAAPLFGMWLVLRTSDWLIPFDILAAGTLLGFGAALARGGSAADATIPELAGRVLRGSIQALFAPAFLWRGAFGGRTTRAGAIARGLLVAAPIVIVVGALLTSADAVFASFFSFDTGNLALHAVLITIGTLGMASLLRLASAEPADVPDVEGPKLGVVESVVTLAALNLLLGAFAAARLVALSEGGRRVIEEAGLTYAEYARTGFFQLLFAAAIVIVAILALRGATPVVTRRQRRAFVGLSLGVVLLTLALCASAFHRLVLYEGQFGLTMLRIYVQTSIVWLAIVLVMLGVVIAMPERTAAARRAWLAPAAAGTALVLLFALNVLNPEAFVARHNLTHPPRAERIDHAYIATLSDDAIASVGENARGDTPGAVELRARICGNGGTVAERGSDTEGWASYNVTRERAEEVRAQLCE